MLHEALAELAEVMSPPPLMAMVDAAGISLSQQALGQLRQMSLSARAAAGLRRVVAQLACDERRQGLRAEEGDGSEEEEGWEPQESAEEEKDWEGGEARLEVLPGLSSLLAGGR